jgi:hypothetical protein
MDRHEGGRWDVAVKSNAVYVQRISDSDEQLFEDLLAPEEARELAGLLTKYAEKVDESDESDEVDESDESDDSDKSGKSEDSDKSDESEDSDKSSKSEDSDKSSD